ncbi:hypothetical protein C8Q80DRAFT_1135152 [Daedaleopsis nitida]|nr:hypothetical protein C8Q80DRAFT_1135152 [Daedaleopsis nitida]
MGKYLQPRPTIHSTSSTCLEMSALSQKVWAEPLEEADVELRYPLHPPRAATVCYPLPDWSAHLAHVAVPAPEFTPSRMSTPAHVPLESQMHALSVNELLPASLQPDEGTISSPSSDHSNA